MKVIYHTSKIVKWPSPVISFYWRRGQILIGISGRIGYRRNWALLVIR